MSESPYTTAARNPQQVPSVGRIVHYVLEVNDGVPEHRPAIIVRVYPDPDGVIHPGAAIVVHVHVDEADGLGALMVQRMPEYEPTGTLPGGWHWPEHVNPR